MAIVGSTLLGAQTNIRWHPKKEVEKMLESNLMARSAFWSKRKRKYKFQVGRYKCSNCNGQNYYKCVFCSGEHYNCDCRTAVTILYDQNDVILLSLTCGRKLPFFSSENCENVDRNSLSSEDVDID